MVEQGTDILIRGCEIYMIAIVAVDGKNDRKSAKEKKRRKNTKKRSEIL